MPLQSVDLGQSETMLLPPLDVLKELEELVQMGYVRGILKKLDDIELAHPEYDQFCQKMRELAESFQLDNLTRQLREIGHDAIEQA